MRLMCLLLAAGTALPTLVAAQGSSLVSTANTSQLSEICRTDHGPDEADFCTGYILATYDQLSLGKRICPPTGASTRQASAIGRKFIADHPERWAEHPSLLLRTAFMAAFPCPWTRYQTPVQN